MAWKVVAVESAAVPQVMRTLAAEHTPVETAADTAADTAAKRLPCDLVEWQRLRDIRSRYFPAWASSA